MRNNFKKILNDPNSKYILLIILVSAFFRLYNLKEFQYWSGDEEMVLAYVRRMVFEHTVSLLTFNTNLGISVGSFFPLISVPLFLIARLNLILILACMSILGILTSIVVYIMGTKIIDRKFGLFSSLVYSGSFLMGLFDRRWWQLSLDPLLTFIAIFASFKLVTTRNLFYLAPIAVGIGFAGHSDPSLGVIGLSTLILITIYKINIFRKKIIPALIILAIFISPLFFFELKHPGTIINPVIHTILRNSDSPHSLLLGIAKIDPQHILANFERFIFFTPTPFADKNFCYCINYKDYPQPFLPLLNIILVLVTLFLPFYLFISKRIIKTEEATFIKVLYIQLIAFFLGISVYTLVFNGYLHQHYFLMAYPIFTFLLGYLVYKVSRYKLLISYILIGLFLIINSYSMLNSKFQYPLYQKLSLVDNTSQKLGSSDFSLYAINDAHGAGFTQLFILNHKDPKKSYVYGFLDWMYRAHSLYTVNPTREDQDKIVIIGPNIKKIFGTNEIYRNKYGNFETVILDNRQRWFDEQKVITKLIN